MSPFRSAQTIRSHWYAVGFTAAYVATAVCAYKWTVGAGGLAILWPCNGLLAAAFLLLRRRDAAIAALICASVDGLGAHWLAQASPLRSLLIGGCDLFEAFTAAVLMRRVCGAAVDLTNIRRLLRMALLAALPATMIAGTVGALLSHVLFGDPIGLLWLGWAVGDLLGMMVGAPAGLIIARFPRYLRDNAAGVGESLAIVLGLCVIAAAQLFLRDQQDAFLIFPFMLLAAFRISAPYSTLAIVAVATITAGVTIGGVGPFTAPQAGATVNLLSLQLFLTCVTVSTLIAQGWLTSLFEARRRAAKALAAARLTTKQAQDNAARQAESEARYRMLADNTTDIIRRVNTDYVVEYVSPSIRQLGYEPEFFLGKKSLSIIHPEYEEELHKRRDAALSGKPGPPYELRVRAASGEWIWLESTVSPIHDASGAVTGIVNVLRNINERKAAEATLRQVNSELQRVARVSALGAFATSLGHELNQPLAAIVANSETSLRWLSREPPDTDEAVKAIERTRDNAWRANQVIGRLRAFVTKEAPVKTEFDAREAVSEVLELTESRRNEASVPVSQALGRSAKRIVADRIQFQQVIMNLVLNAVEAMQDVPADERRLFVSCKKAAGGGVEIKIEDRGPGIEFELKQKIFDNLFTTKTGGTGLGLPISRSIVEAHGGTLTVEDADPRGAAFKVQLPTADQAKGV